MYIMSLRHWNTLFFYKPESWPFSACILLASWPMSWVARSPSLGPGRMLGDRPNKAWFIASPFWWIALERNTHTRTHKNQLTLIFFIFSQSIKKTIKRNLMKKADLHFMRSHMLCWRRWICPWLSFVWLEVNFVSKSMGQSFKPLLVDALSSVCIRQHCF